MHDKYQTPPAVCKYMVDMVPLPAKTILEPTPGMGNIVSELHSRHDIYGYKVTAPSDFFLLDRNQYFDCVVMNPPFTGKSAILDNAPSDVEKGMKLGYYMLTECMKMSHHVIALMPWFTISDSDVRLRFLKAYGLKSITALPRKTFDYVRIQTCVLELEKGFEGATLFHHFQF